MPDEPETERGSTHFHGCWLQTGHHRCALTHIEALERQLGKARGIASEIEKSVEEMGERIRQLEAEQRAMKHFNDQARVG